jgi:peptidyl-prolyl cis-trans isomerase C
MNRENTSFISTFFGALFLLVLAVSSGCTEKKEGTILARFDGTSITDKEFNQKLVTLPKQIQSAVIRNKKEFIEDMASEHFLLKEAERRGLEKSQDVQNLLEAAHKKIVVAKLIENEVDKKVKITPEEAQQYYENHKEEFMTPALFKASHILLKTEEEAKEIRAQILAGADFEEIARKKSIDSTAIRGGDLGFFQKGQLVPEFEDAAMKMKKGELSEVIKTQFGYHLIKLTDRMEPTLREFKAVKSLVEERMVNEKRSRLFKAFIEKIKGNKKIEIDEKALENLNSQPLAATQ